MKARTSAAIIIILMLFLGMIALGTYVAYRVTQVKLLTWLTEEIGPYPVLTSYTTGELKPGTVFQVIADKQGWQIKQKDTQLYEKLTLSNVDISVNDVASMHLFDAYVAPSDTPGANYVYLGDVTPYNGSYTMVMWARGYPSDNEVSNIMVALSGYTGYYRIVLIENGLYYAVGKEPYSASYYEDVYKTWISTREPEFAIAYDYNTNTSYYIDSDETVTSTSIQHGFGYIIRLGYDLDWDTSNIDARSQDPSRWAYFILYTKLVDVTRILQRHIVTDTDWWHFFDATWFNGTHYLDIKDGTPFQVVGTVTRIPAEQTWLWLIKGLTSDNKLHFKWFPAGTIIKIKDSNGNVIREFTIDGTPVNDDGQIEDYAISLDTTTLPSATIEAYVPSFKVRVYAPYGSIVKILDDQGNSYGEKEVGTSGYADIALSKSIENAKIVVAGKDYVENKLDIQVSEKNDGTIEVTVMDDRGVLIPGMLVRIADPSGVVIYAYTTGQDGKVSFEPDRPLPEITVEVSGVWDGVIHYTKKEVKLSASVEAATATESPSSLSKADKAFYAGLGALIILTAVAALTVKRRR